MKNTTNIETITPLVCKDYINNITIKQLITKYEINDHTIHNILKRNNIPIRWHKSLKKVNHNYFDNLDTPNKAYFLGFLYADGCIITRKQGQMQIVINLHEKDKHILDSFKKELEFEGDLHFYDGKKMVRLNGKERNNLYRLTVSSDILCNALIKLGCEPRKTLTCKFPTKEQVPDHLMPHFVRGLMDGDGHISLQQLSSKNLSFIFGIVGTTHICEGVRALFAEKLITDPNKKMRFKPNLCGVYYANYKDILKIYNYLYPENTELFLIRKHDKFKQIKNYKPTSYVKLSYEELLNSKACLP